MLYDGDPHFRGYSLIRPVGERVAAVETAVLQEYPFATADTVSRLESGKIGGLSFSLTGTDPELLRKIFRVTLQRAENKKDAMFSIHGYQAHRATYGEVLNTVLNSDNIQPRIVGRKRMIDIEGEEVFVGTTKRLILEAEPTVRKVYLPVPKVIAYKLEGLDLNFQVQEIARIVKENPLQGLLIACYLGIGTEKLLGINDRKVGGFMTRHEDDLRKAFGKLNEKTIFNLRLATIRTQATIWGKRGNNVFLRPSAESYYKALEIFREILKKPELINDQYTGFIEEYRTVLPRVVFAGLSEIALQHPQLIATIPRLDRDNLIQDNFEGFFTTRIITAYFKDYN